MVSDPVVACICVFVARDVFLGWAVGDLHNLYKISNWS